MVLKLWTLRNGPGGALVKKEDGRPFYFEDKVTAKSVRNRLNAGSNVPSIVVAHGPDHRLGQAGDK